MNDGEQALTNRVFPNEQKGGLQLYAKDGNAKLKSLDIWKMKSIW